jgi:hypothetical protein
MLMFEPHQIANDGLTGRMHHKWKGGEGHQSWKWNQNY